VGVHENIVGVTILIHHPASPSSGEISSFVRHIHEIAEGSNLLIACPYISLRVLRPILGRARGWRILTDFEELLRSHAPSQRAEVIRFLADSGDRVRHWPGLHAKVIVGDDAALVGSANLTEAGLGQRQEMAVRLDAPALLEKLRAWFMDLWERCSAPSSETLRLFASCLPRELSKTSAPRLESPAPRLSVTVLSAHNPPERSNDELRLRERVARAVSRAWIDGYLDMCADLLETLEIREDDARLSMTIPRSNKSLPITINQRYAITSFRKGRRVIGLMLPHGFEVPSVLVPAFRKVRDRLGSFKPWPDERPDDVPQFGYFEVEHPSELEPIREAWLCAVSKETERSWKHSAFRRYHVCELYRAVIDRDYRATLLGDAFREGSSPVR